MLGVADSDNAMCLLVSPQGGAIGIVIDWTCNLDLDVKHCKPKYDFHGLYGNPAETDRARASVGYNFRSASGSTSSPVVKLKTCKDHM